MTLNSLVVGLDVMVRGADAQLQQNRTSAKAKPTKGHDA
jgi:hypothetical protein